MRSTASYEISKALGQQDAVGALERSLQAGDISSVEFWNECASRWIGINQDIIDHAFRSAPWMGGVRDVFADIAARAEHSVVITQSPQFFVDRLLNWGVGRVFGAQVAVGEAATQELMVSADTKVFVTNMLLEELGFGESECIAYGDSFSDIALFEKLSYTVAVNPSEIIERLGAVTYRGTDLRRAYRLGRYLSSSGLDYSNERPNRLRSLGHVKYQ